MARSKNKGSDLTARTGKSATSATAGAWLPWALVAAAAAVFIWVCVKYQLTQDDAYISFRYAANFLNGHGLVFNIGERVEGYTNFLWVIILALCKNLFGIDFITTSQVLGVAAGAMTFWLIYLLIGHHYRENRALLMFAVAIALLANFSLAYWAIASLETAAFACMVLATLVAEYRKPQLTPALLIISSLLRPEGVVVFGICFLNRLITDRVIPLRFALTFIIPLIPFAAFKLGYYGSLFPNPYYAKSGVGLEYIQTGLEYLWYFTRSVGVYGFVFLLPMLAVRWLWARFSLLYIFVLVYTAYIVWVGGDVLYVYRFFVPVVPALYFLFVISAWELGARLIRALKVARVTAIVVVLGFAISSYQLSIDHVRTYMFFEQNIIRKMHFLGFMMKKHFGPDFSVAASTIGMISYELLGHRVIDLLGLTDSYIARNPEQIPGMSSSWKERRFNCNYLLRQNPDVILFSTGYKPSAPAERALLMHSEFRRNYAPMGFLREKQYKIFWQRDGVFDSTRDVVHPDIDFVSRLVDGLYHNNRTGPDRGLEYFREAQARLGEPYFVLDYAQGWSFSRMGQKDSARYYYHQAIEHDTMAFEAYIGLARLAVESGDAETANRLDLLIRSRWPWLTDMSYRSPFPPISVELPD